MDKSRYVERMLGVENLTDELEDDQADWLLKWGVARMDDALAVAGDDPEAAGNQANALMAVMRKINRLTAARQRADMDTLVEGLVELSELIGAAFSSPCEVTPDECRAAAALFGAMTDQEAVEFLAFWRQPRRPV